MRFAYLLAVFTSASPLGRDIQRRGNLPEPVDVATAKKYLDELTIAPPVTEPPYDRTKFRHWIPINGTCDTRETVLKRDAIAGVEVITDEECRLLMGAWSSDYDGQVVTSVSGLDIDHIVPLKEAWQAGAWNWTAQRRKEFANDLEGPQLLAVSASSNRMKGDKDPSKWMPSNPDFHCKYVRAWIQTKHDYGLTVDEVEKNKLTEFISSC